MSAVLFSLLFLCIVPSLSRPWQDAAQPIEQRVDDLLAKMTVEEKINQLTSWDHYPPDTFEYGVGRIKATGNTPESIVSFHNAQQEIIMNASRLNIPASIHAEALHSACPGCTVFPTPITQGCSWNTSLITEITTAIALSSRSLGTDVVYSPVLNMWTDPRFGRASEGYSENPTLSAHYARAAVKGFQDDNASGPFSYLADDKTISLAKHYAAYGAAIGGLNAAPSDISLRTMFEVYLKPWRAFGKAGGRAAMTSHQTFNRVPMHSNSYMVNDIFRNRFGFGEGQIVSDCNDIGVLQNYRIASNKSQAGARALLGGVDLDLICADPPSSQQAGCYLQLQDAIKSGWINEATLNQSVARVLAGKFAVGLFDGNAFVNDTNAWKKVVNTEANIELAYIAALQSIVLLQAKNNMFSLKDLYDNDKLKSIAFIGPNAQCNTNQTGKLCDTAINYLGPYTLDDDLIEVPTVFQAFQQSNKYKDLKITYNEGVDIQSTDTKGIPAAITAAKAADAVVIVIGDNDGTCGEWQDNDNLDPPGQQLNLTTQIVNQLKGTGIPIVLVTINGRQYTFADGNPQNTVLDGVDILLNAFRPGQQGGVALRDVIMGDAENSGRIAQNWPKIVGDVNSGSNPWLQEVRGKWVANSRSKPDPDGRIYDSYQNEQKLYDELTEPLFEFGFGLSNTGCSSQFKYSNLKIKVVNNKPIQNDTDVVMQVTADVTNQCKTTATDVFQVYLVDPPMLNMDINAPILVRYWKRLIGFQKFRLDGGKSTTLSVDVIFDDIAIYTDAEFKNYQLVKGEYTVRVGQSSRTDIITATVTL